jgi:DNA-binding transcriptional ArsR family regulator
LFGWENGLTFINMNMKTLPAWDDLATTFKILSHPARLQIAAVLSEQETCVCHLEALLGRRQAYISQQLMVLRKAGWLTERREGHFVFYGLAEERVATVLAQATAVFSPASISLPMTAAACNCPQCSF